VKEGLQYFPDDYFEWIFPLGIPEDSKTFYNKFLYNPRYAVKGDAGPDSRIETQSKTFTDTVQLEYVILFVLILLDLICLCCRQWSF
jgi:hypothetical protein